MPKANSVTVAHLTALGTIMLWGTTFIATKILLRDFTPIEILFLRFLLGFFALTIFFPRRLPIRNWREERLYIGAGLTGVTLYFLFENIALTYTLASNVGVLVTVAPFFTVLLSYFFLKEEKLSLFFYGGFVLAFAGVVLISFPHGFSGEWNLTGDILALLAALAWAVYSVFMKKIGQLGYPMVLCTRRTFFYGLLFMIPALWGLDFSPDWAALAKPVNAANFLFLGLGASAVCFATWNWVVKVIGAVKSSVYIYLVPVVAVLMALLVLGERITTASACGMAAALAGLILSEKGRR